MIRFFKSIRQNLIKENKVVKYLWYAIGEILLVMIGILLALQVNNWNEERKLEGQKRELIEDLKTDSQTNLRRLDASIERAEIAVSSIIDFLKAAVGENPDLSVDELRSLATKVFTPVRFQPTLGSYHSGISTGLFNRIQGNRLKELFLDFELEFARYQRLLGMVNQDQFAGSIKRVRDKLGSLHIFYETPLFKPEMYSMTDQEYREFIAHKEVYSDIETKLSLRLRQRASLRELKEITEEILEILESL